MVGKGLEREYDLLRELLNGHDIYTVGIHYTDLARATLVRADATIFLEVIHPLAVNLSKENWLVPNSEWWFPQNDRFLPQMTKVLCKTRDCLRIWSKKVDPHKCTYVGFESRDLYRPDIAREMKFLHVAGESEFKNTESVIGAWRRTMLQNVFKRPPLTVVTRQKKYRDLCEGVEGIMCIERASEDEIVQLMNSHRFHLIPSAYEGFGHALNEGIGCGALVITTDGAPMNEFPGIVKELAVPVARTEPRSLAQLCHVTEDAVLDSVRRAVILDRDRPAYVEELSRIARRSFLESRESFRKKILELVGVS